MRRLALALAVALVGLSDADGAPVRPPRLRPHPPVFGPRSQRRRFSVRPFLRPPRIRPRPPPLLQPSPPPDEFLQPLPPEPEPPLEGPIAPPSLAHGFELTVSVGAGASFRVPPTLGRYVDVGQALGACFAPPAGLAWGAVTLRVSFKRDGTVFGEPRIPYSDAGSPEQKTELARSLLAALQRCTPLHLSASLGGAIAGEIFAIRFIHQDKP